MIFLYKICAFAHHQKWIMTAKCYQTKDGSKHGSTIHYILSKCTGCLAALFLESEYCSLHYYFECRKNEEDIFCVLLNMVYGCTQLCINAAEQRVYSSVICLMLCIFFEWLYAIFIFTSSQMLNSRRTKNFINMFLMCCQFINNGNERFWLDEYSW